MHFSRPLSTGPNSQVYFARYRIARDVYRPVAVKVPSNETFKMQSIIDEMRINAQLRHPRVVEYIGYYRDIYDDVRIVSEFMAGGDLHAFLINQKNELNVGHIFNFICQIAEGMEYLISQRIIHRDLAARNCMLSLDGTAIKISDFGLSRQFSSADANYESSTPHRLPLRWMPLECFGEDGEMLRNCKFNEKTDVWSFGVVVWECFTRGAQPYGGSTDFNEVIIAIKKQNVAGVECMLKLPTHCPPCLYDQLVLKCWAPKQEQRPNFTTIRTILEEIFEELMTNCPDQFGKSVK